MSESSETTGRERIVFAQLLGVTFGAALGTTVLRDVTVGVVAGVVVGTTIAVVFPAWTDRRFEDVTKLLDG